MKILKSIGFVLMALAMGCTEEHFNYDDPTDIAMFALTNRQLLVSDAVAENIFDIEVCSPVTSPENRKYLVTLLAGTGEETDAIENTNFEILSSLLVEIPAGEHIGSFQMKVIQSSLRDDIDTYVFFTLEAYDETHPVASFNCEMTVMLTKVCQMEIAEMSGKYKLISGIHGTTKNGLTITADPEHEDGLILVNAYPGSDIPLRLWLREDGRYSVRTRGEVLMGAILTDEDTGKFYDAMGSATGEYNPCNGRMELNFVCYPVGYPDNKYLSVEVFIKE